MKNVILATALVFSTAFSAHAISMEIDSDGDGVASLAELQVTYPDLTDALFQEIDTDSNGFVDDEEMEVAVEAGTIPDPEVDS